MLMSSVLDPTVLESYRYADGQYHQQVERYLLGIMDNGLLVVDHSERLKADLFESASRLAQTRNGIHSRILLEEILKRGKRKIVKALAAHTPAEQEFKSVFAHQVSCYCGADLFLTCCAQVERLDPEQCANVVAVEDYSPYHLKETRRHDLASRTYQIDENNNQEFNSLIIGSIRFTKWIRFYDSQIGHASGNLWSFRDGIRTILNLYNQNGYFSQEPGGFVEIYTKQSALDEGAFVRLSNDFLAPLKRAFPLLRIRLFVKSDPYSIFHARYLESQHAILHVDAGFDLFNKAGKYRTNMIRLDQDRLGHLQRCRELPDLYKEDS